MHVQPQVNTSVEMGLVNETEDSGVSLAFFFLPQKIWWKRINHVEEQAELPRGRQHGSIPRCCSALVKQIKLAHQYVSNFM